VNSVLKEIINVIFPLQVKMPAKRDHMIEAQDAYISVLVSEKPRQRNINRPPYSTWCSHKGRFVLTLVYWISAPVLAQVRPLTVPPTIIFMRGRSPLAARAAFIYSRPLINVRALPASPTLRSHRSIRLPRCLLGKNFLKRANEIQTVSIKTVGSSICRP